MAPLHSGNHATVKWYKGPKDVSVGKVLPAQMQGLEFLSLEPMQSKIWQCPSSDAGVGDSQKPKARQPFHRAWTRDPVSNTHMHKHINVHVHVHTYTHICTHMHIHIYVIN